MADVPKRLPFVAASDGTLFLSAIDTIFANRPSKPGVFDVIATLDTVCVYRSRCFTIVDELFATSPDTLYGVSRSVPIFKWTPADGLISIETPFTDSTYWCGDFAADARISDIGRFDNEMIAVASHGYVLSGTDTWKVSYVGRPQRVSLCYSDYEDALNSIGGTDDAVWAAGSQIVRLRPDVKWMKRPPESRGLITAIAELDGLIIFGVREPAHFLIFDGRRFLIQQLREYGMNTLENGGKQPDGSVLLWGSGGLVYMKDRALRVVRFAGRPGVIAAVIRDEDLFVVLSSPDRSAVIARVPLSSVAFDTRR